MAILSACEDWSRGTPLLPLKEQKFYDLPSLFTLGLEVVIDGQVEPRIRKMIEIH
jgi:hypothetical protein